MQKKLLVVLRPLRETWWKIVCDGCLEIASLPLLYFILCNPKYREAVATKWPLNHAL